VADQIHTRAILLVDHGSRRDEANAQLEELAERVRAQRPDWAVHTAHLEIAEPRVAEALDLCAAAGIRDVYLHPFFLSPGRHTREDLPALAREASERHPGLTVHLTDPLGVGDAMVAVVLERIDACR
jgi:sirohydrochlorin ferrochelatase